MTDDERHALEPATPYSNYEGQSVGRILHFVTIYCGLHYGERVTVEGRIIKYRRATFATILWVADVPSFTFVGPNAKDYQKIQNEKPFLGAAMKSLTKPKV